MSRRPSRLQCGALAGLALLFSVSLVADERVRDAVRKQLRDESYILVEDHGNSRLYLLSSDAGIDAVLLIPDTPGVTDKALAMTRSADARQRVRGLTLLAAETDAAARDAALALVADPVAAVREEAYLLLLEHPHADVAGIAALAQTDSSARVREAVAELLAEQSGD